jgi:ubiquinone/menaquinone biosynthesis C-methylase UbiE
MWHVVFMNVPAMRNLSLALLIVVFASLVWRWLSRRHSLPCPTLLAGALEHPLMDKLAGTQTTLNRMGLQPGQRVLEVGPGPGRLLIPAARRVLPGGHVVGLDIQPGMLERLRARAVQAGVSNITTLQGDVTHPQVSPESFDVVYLCTVLGEIPDRAAALRQCYAALTPGGRLSITEILPDPHFQSRTTVRRLAEQVGFQLQTRYGSWYFYTANFIKPSSGDEDPAINQRL